MILKSINLNNFRCWANAKVDFCDNMNIVYGENAAGKTNLLESVFFFAAGKSFRGCKDRELIKFGENTAFFEIDFETEGSNIKMGAGITRGQKKKLFRNGFEITKLSEFLGVFRGVIFAPEHLSLIKGSPEGRRRFLDMAVCQAFPRSISSLNEYNRTLAQKNALLRSEKYGPGCDALLDIYNEKLAAAGAIITINRRKYLKKLCEEANPVQNEMSLEKEKLELNYISQSQGDSSKEVKKSWEEIFQSKKETEKAKKMTVCGPQKDDFSVFINSKSAKLYASQGQQRTAVLALKIAEGELSKKLTGEYPVFLFDDVLSELDACRKKFVLENLKNRQFIITGCEKELFDAHTGSEKKLFYVKEGQIFAR